MKSFKILFAICAVFSMCSCQKNEVLDSTAKSDDLVEYHQMDMQSLMNICDNTVLYLDSCNVALNRSDQTNAAAVMVATEDAIKAEYAPLIESGKEVQQALIELSNNPSNDFSLTPEELELVESLDESQLAQLSFELSTVYKSDEVAELNGLSIKSEDIVSCAAEALGINAIIDLGAWACGGFQSGLSIVADTTKLITSFRGLALHYLGWLGLAVTVCQFARCVHGKTHPSK